MHTNEVLLRSNHLKNSACLEGGAMESVRLGTRASSHFTLLVDDRCDVVRRLSAMLRLWDKQRTFMLISRQRTDGYFSALLDELDRSPWSLILIDDFNARWSGAEAIPFILKNLPFGKMAAVMYTIPGSMWLTKKLYLWVSQNRRRLKAS